MIKSRDFESNVELKSKQSAIFSITVFSFIMSFATDPLRAFLLCASGFVVVGCALIRRSERLRRYLYLIPAVVHVDGTARPQLVRADRNPLYHALIERYSEISGIPLVLNTSFNVHEEPIVCAPTEGIRALREDRIDALAIGPFWVDNSSHKAVV